MQKGRGKGALWAQGMQGAKIGDEWSPMARQRRSVALPAQVCPELLSHPSCHTLGPFQQASRNVSGSKLHD